MTERAIAGIVAEAERRWPLLGCTVIHRVGRLVPGENIVLVLAAAAHRQAALDGDRVPDRLAEDQGAVLEAGSLRRRLGHVGSGARRRRRRRGAMARVLTPRLGTCSGVCGLPALAHDLPALVSAFDRW